MFDPVLWLFIMALVGDVALLVLASLHKRGFRRADQTLREVDGKYADLYERHLVAKAAGEGLADLCKKHEATGEEYKKALAVLDVRLHEARIESLGLAARLEDQRARADAAEKRYADMIESMREAAKTPPPVDAVNTREAAAILGVSPRTVRRWARKGSLTEIDVGPYPEYRFDRAAVEALALSHGRTP